MREAAISVSDEDLAAVGLGDFVSLCRAAGLRDVTELSCRGTGGVLLVTTARPLDGARLDDVDAVERWEAVSEGGAYVYLVSFAAPDLPDRVADSQADLVGDCAPEVTDRGATMTLVGPQGAIRDTVREYEDAGMSVGLQALSAFDGRDRALDALTDRQREVLRTAFDEGYYEVPREATTEDVAATLALDPSTVTEHLQRAEHNLLAAHFGGG